MTITKNQNEAAPVAPEYDGIVNVKEHEKKMASLRAAKAKRQPELRKMLDPEYAAETEARKSRDQYRVTCVLNARDGGKMTSEEKTGIVTAQNPDQAWKKFCDQMRTWPSPKWCDRKIEKV